MLVVGFLIFSPAIAKKESKVTVTSNSTLYDGDSILISLTDLNGTPIANQTVNITIVDANGGENRQIVTTDANGIGNLQLNGLTIGYYTIKIYYGGNDEFKSCNTTQKLEMKDRIVESQSTSLSSTGSGDDSTYGSYINDEWVPMSEAEYASRYPVLYHQKSLQEGRYDEYHPQMYEVDAENGLI
ncbi:carboxypeptidase-like regulatory domain-containing protein [Methanobrevibacter sp.]|uniref:carboxypeptidase-like regulatory domain-containing protein n=1 Tax=Methanobrevibacter sp. TaxID=66852 RepID=UPI0038901615